MTHGEAAASFLPMARLLLRFNQSVRGARGQRLAGATVQAAAAIKGGRFEPGACDRLWAACSAAHLLKAFDHLLLKLLEIVGVT